MMHPGQLENQMNNQYELDHQLYPEIPEGPPEHAKLNQF